MLTFLARWLHPFGSLVAHYPALLAVAVGLIALVHGWVLAEYDAFHIVWHDSWVTGIANGVLVAFILGLVVSAVREADERVTAATTKAAKPPEESRRPYQACWLLLLLACVAGGVIEGRSEALVDAALDREEQRASLPVVAADGTGTGAEAGAEKRPAWDWVPFWPKWWQLWFVVGMAVAVAVYFVAHARFDRDDEPADDTRRKDSCPEDPTPPASLSWLGWVCGRPAAACRWATSSVVALALSVLLVGYSAMWVVHFNYPAAYTPWVPASVSFLLLVALLTAFLGVLTRSLVCRRRWVRPVLLVLLVVPFAFPQNQIENRLPNMGISGTSSGTAGTTYYDKPARLAGYDALRQPPKLQGGLPPELLAWNKRMETEFGSPQPLVIVTCSGGASASAIYTADVLFTLEAACPGFSKRVRLISGASGGMLGAAYFVRHLWDGRDEAGQQKWPPGLIAEAQDTDEYREYVELLRRTGPVAPDELRRKEEAYRGVMTGIRTKFFAGLEADFLSPLVQKWVHKDMPTSPFGLFSRVDRRLGVTTNDRGAALERAWAAHQDGALDVPFRDLRAAELAGALPSLVFTPMMIEDGRQLVISNLDLDYMTETGRKETGKVVGGSPQSLSYMGAEFFKLFPKADDFRLSTAVRMNASFPLFSPAAALPTDPVRHVVDAGYYDNFGMVAATKWLLYPPNRQFMVDKFTPDKEEAGKTPEVLLLRIRCFGDQQTPRMIPTRTELEEFSGEPISPTGFDGVAKEWAKAADDRPPVRTESGLFTVTAPLAGLFSAWRANMAYRADERLAAVLREYDNEVQVTGRNKSVKVTVTDLPLFCRTEPSLNWVLTRRDREAIHKDVERDLVSSIRWENFKQGRGGKTDADPVTPPVRLDSAARQAGRVAGKISQLAPPEVPVKKAQPPSKK